MADLQYSLLHKELIKELASSDEAYRDFADIAALTQDEFKREVSDAPSKSYVLDRSGKCIGVLLLSNHTNPALIGRSVARAREAAEALGPELASVIIKPLAEGHFDDLSYVIWPLHRDLSHIRLLGFVQKKKLISPVFNWLRAQSSQTAMQVQNDVVDDFFRDPLARMSDDNRFSDTMRAAANLGLQRLEAGVWQPYTVMQHGDFWLGNILLPHKGQRQNHPYGFIVIDWAGAKMRGYPFADLVRMSSSIGLSRRLLLREVLRLSQIIKCEICDAESYLLASIGHLGSNLEHFPEHRFLRGSIRSFNQLRGVVPTKETE